CGATAYPGVTTLAARQLAQPPLGPEALQAADQRVERDHAADHPRVAERADRGRQARAGRQERGERVEQLVGDGFDELAGARTRVEQVGSPASLRFTA